jgi:hypothetical protein
MNGSYRTYDLPDLEALARQRAEENYQKSQAIRQEFLNTLEKEQRRMEARGRLSKAIKKAAKVRADIKWIKNFSDRWSARLSINGRLLRKHLAEVKDCQR